jgi:hypothetical protein
MNVLEQRKGDWSHEAVEHGLADRELHDAVLRAVRQPAGRVAVVLHLSRLAPPAPRPHHRRIARALLQDSAARHEGQVFALPSGDLVLLCRAGSPSAARPVIADPLALPDILSRLLRVDAPDPGHVVSLWHLAQDAGKLIAYASARAAPTGPEPVAEEDFAGQPSLVHAIGLVVNTAAIGDLMRLQTAIVLSGTGGGAPADGLLPLYREVTFSVSALQSRISAGGHVGADPFLFRYLATRFDQRMLDVLRAELGAGGPWDPLGTGGMLPAPSLHVNLTLPGIASPAFARFAEACGRLGAQAAVEVSLIEATADPAGFARARATVAEAGLALVLDGVTHLALLISRPWTLLPDLLKLDWSPRLMDLPEAEAMQLDAALVEIGPHRVVLHRAETEAALRWGLARGIRRFQGRHVDAMLGASRIVGCTRGASCTLRQCIERAAATGAAGRVGCNNLPLLNAGAPSPLFPMARPRDPVA